MKIIVTGAAGFIGFHLINKLIQKKIEDLYLDPSSNFKNKKLKVYYNNSEMMQSIGIMMPVFNLGKKMHMNH